MSPNHLRAEAKRLGDALTLWTLRYPRRSRTYRQFWTDYKAANSGFDALISLPNLPDDVVDAGMIVRDLPLHLGLEPESRCPVPSMDDLIQPT